MVLSAALSAGCSSHTGAAVGTALAQPEEPAITVAALPSNDLAGLYIAQDDGLFAGQGLRVTIETIASSQAVIDDQLNGQVDISAGSYVPYIAAQAAGSRFRILAEASILNPGTRMLVTPAASHIDSIAGLAGQKIGVNGTDSIGTLLVSALLEEHGVSPKKVHFITDLAGFPAMPAQLQAGSWGSAFLAEPYATIAEQDYGDRELADLDQGTTESFPIDGYVATQAWAEKYPKTAAAFVRAIQEGQAIADNKPLVVQAAIAKSDDLSAQVTAVMALPGFPTGPGASAEYPAGRRGHARVRRAQRAVPRRGREGVPDPVNDRLGRRYRQGPAARLVLARASPPPPPGQGTRDGARPCPGCSPTGRSTRLTRWSGTTGGRCTEGCGTPPLAAIELTWYVAPTNLVGATYHLAVGLHRRALSRAGPTRIARSARAGQPTRGCAPPARHGLRLDERAGESCRSWRLSRSISSGYCAGR